MQFLRTRTAVGLALLGAIVVAVATLALFGFGIPAAAAAARSTARFSGLLLAIAIAWPALGEGARRFAPVSTLLYVFVAGHAVHYAAVVNLAVVDASHHLHQLQPAALGVAAFGTILLLAVALSIGAERGWQLGLHRASVGIAWLLFVLAFGSRAREHGLELALLAVMLVALAMRLRSSLVARRAAKN